MNSSATIVFAPTRLVPVHIPDQPRAGTHRLAAVCIAGTFNRSPRHPALCGQEPPFIGSR